MRFRNPDNGYEVVGTTGISWLWVFLWAPLYYAVKGIWSHALISFALVWLIGGSIGVFTFGLSTLLIAIIYAVFNGKIVRNYYLSRGWAEVNG